MENLYFGYFNGEQCNRNGCTGVILELEKEGSCSCHINPPCSHCTESTAYCPSCDWSGNDDYNYDSKNSILSDFKDKDTILTALDSRKYKVVKYFDTYPEKVISENLSSQEADEKINSLKSSYLVSYEKRLME